MAKLSEQKKVELLENEVLTGTVENTAKIIAEYGPFEFTARALGYAARFRGPEMLKCLIDGGAVFTYEASAAFVKKYAIKVVVSNNYSYSRDYSLYLLKDQKIDPEPDGMQFLSDEDRVQVLRLLHANAEQIGFHEGEVLFFSILYGDSAIRQACAELGIAALTEKRAANIRCDINYAHMDGLDRCLRDDFTWALRRAKPDDFKRILADILPMLGEKQMQLMPADLYEDITDKKQFFTGYCAEGVFELARKHTNLTDKVKKWDMLYALADQNNASGMQYALEQEWISKPKDLETLLKYVQNKGCVNAALIGSIMDKLEKTSSGKRKSAPLTLNTNPTSVAEMKKIWGFKKQEDGTLMITSYKGEEQNIVIPALIGKTEVTAIDADTFNPNAPRITEIQKEIRLNIISIEFPGSIKVIPQNMFIYSAQAHGKLNRIILNEGIEKICSGAFRNCIGIEEIVIPNSVKEIGNYAFLGCRKLKKIQLPNGIESLTTGVFEGTGLVNFAVPDTVINFGSSIFKDCADMVSVTLSDSMDKIPNYMFSGCVSLSTFDLSDNISAIGNGAFSRCSFEEFVVPESVKTIGLRAFDNCKKLKSIRLPKETAMADEAFLGCCGLANERGQIVVNGKLFGILDSSGGNGLTVEDALKPLVIGSEITDIAVSRDSLPEITCRECSETGTEIDVSALAVGDEVFFGRFPESEDFIMKPLKWRVLDIVDGKALLITVREIISQREKLKQTDTWDVCPVRKLLNDGFYKTAFAELEQNQIVLSMISTPKNKEQRVDGGPDTEDRIFLLSKEEVEKYMAAEESRKSEATEYAHKQHSARRDTGFWQLRTPGKDGWGSVAISDYSGNFSASTGNHVGYSYLRPAMWIR